MTGRSIRIFLVDGAVAGLRTTELGLSTIKALVIPRASLQSVTKRPEVQKTGLYILVGKDENKPGVLKIYQTARGATAWKTVDTNLTFAEWQELQIPQSSDS